MSFAWTSTLLGEAQGAPPKKGSAGPASKTSAVGGRISLMRKINDTETKDATPTSRHTNAQASHAPTTQMPETAASESTPMVIRFVPAIDAASAQTSVVRLSHRSLTPGVELPNNQRNGTQGQQHHTHGTNLSQPSKPSPHPFCSARPRECSAKAAKSARARIAEVKEAMRRSISKQQTPPIQPGMPMAVLSQSDKVKAQTTRDAKESNAACRDIRWSARGSGAAKRAASSNTTPK
mmetsp:Transcript_71111/g.191505  ORF Transcript_71111/g.191505 Transcript_71111/m.191505 type:complete len:236 (+) Transcript_71111:28-735(+)